MNQRIKQINERVHMMNQEMAGQLEETVQTMERMTKRLREHQPDQN